MNELEIIKREIAELKKWKSIIESSSFIPLNLDYSIRERFNIKNKIEGTGIGTFGTQTINLTGESQSINVPAQPTKTLKIKFGGADYELLVK